LDFREFDTSTLTSNDFVYVDPPYLITCATYNEQGGWDETAEKDLLAFFNALSSLSLPREDFARAVGFDLIFWVKGRNRIKEYNPSSCRILEFWRRELLDGRLSLDDVRWWWRYGIRRWIKTGDLSLLEKSVDWRQKVDSIFSPRAFYFFARIWGR
jgi:hypothetical protein